MKRHIETKENIAFYLKHEWDEHFLDLTKQLQEQNDGSILQELFDSNIQFGTGGLRGLMKPGFNAMNPLTVHLASQGLGLYARSLYKRPLSAVVSYDTRLYSKEFAIITAQTFVTLGIAVKIFANPTPVPLLSYAVRKEEADFGVMITASHNPKEYNGYKVYWSAGEQVIAPHDKAIEKAIEEVEPIEMISEQEASKKNLWTWIDDEILKSYHDEIFNLEVIRLLYPEAKSKLKSKICYTPLHGSGLTSVQYLLESAGFDVIVPEEQAAANGNFPTVKTPNPEDAENLTMAITLAKKENASLVLATDPDADRLGVAVLHDGEFVVLTGNQIGALALHFIIDVLEKNGQLPDNALFVNTIVTSPLQNKIARAHHVIDKRVLTGFKHIAEVIAQSEKERSSHYIFGCEESYGYLIHTLARDKDAPSMALLMALMHEYYLQEQSTLIDILNHLHASYGYHLDKQLNYTLEGAAGITKIQHMMDHLSIKYLDGVEIQTIYDYRKQKIYDVHGKNIEQEEPLPEANVLQFALKDGTLISARPSGTEPKIKFYISLTANNEVDALNKMHALENVIKLFVVNYL